MVIRMSKYTIRIPSIEELTDGSPETEMMKNFNTSLTEVFETKGFNEYIRLLLNLFIKKKTTTSLSSEIIDCISRTLIQNSESDSLNDLSIMYFASPNLLLNLPVSLEFTSSFNISKEDLINVLIKSIKENCNLSDYHSSLVEQMLHEIIN